jgi:hypothetical protein
VAGLFVHVAAQYCVAADRPSHPCGGVRHMRLTVSSPRDDARAATSRIDCAVSPRVQVHRHCLLIIGMGAVKDHARRIGFPIIAARVPSGSAAQCFNFRFPYVCPIWPHPPIGVHLAREAGWRESPLFTMLTNHNAFVDNLHVPSSYVLPKRYFGGRKRFSSENHQSWEPPFRR